MSSQGGAERCSAAAGKLRKWEEKVQEKEEEDFYDCQETFGLQEKEEQGDRLQEEQEEQGDRLHEKEEQGDRLHAKEEQGDGLHEKEEQGDGLQEKEEQGDGLQEKKEQGDGLQEEEEQGDGLQEEEEQGVGLQEEENSDSEMKEEDSRAVELDDDYLREVEKVLTEEEKEGRRNQSLTLKEKGNSQFKAGDWVEAERSYTEALGLCPVCFSKERAVLFSNRAAARLHLDLKEQAIADCTRELNPDYLRALLRRADLYEQTEKLDEALEDYKRVLDQDPNQTRARHACMRLPQQIQERNEKLKEEMISKLKDLGNMILRPFGLSTNNFQVNQDQDTGSYSINFVQNPNNNR
ncbi:tetratricopeptide repeat protein 1 isoform X2 [Mastacembelus armatus]|uniref:tetratricopeptide repeat protein 1 isoform X2 n=1 Tax=Mastacembelus armatus TaxID=205130 RepID=UPI000E45AC65|nr:tetratricopeptide repeat protein 1-like isoform X2 [Mastacembelus armatus]